MPQATRRTYPGRCFCPMQHEGGGRQQLWAWVHWWGQLRARGPRQGLGRGQGAARGQCCPRLCQHRPRQGGPCQLGRTQVVLPRHLRPEQREGRRGSALPGNRKGTPTLRPHPDLRPQVKVLLGAQDMTYPWPPRVLYPLGLWLHMGSSRKSGRRGCFLAKRATLLGRNRLFFQAAQGCRAPETPAGWGSCSPTPPTLRGD